MDDSVDRNVRTEPYKGAAGGWGSAKSLGKILHREGVLVPGAVDLVKQNKKDGRLLSGASGADNPSDALRCRNR
jgi:hypothetical protein